MLNEWAISRFSTRNTAMIFPSVKFLYKIKKGLPSHRNGKTAPLYFRLTANEIITFAKAFGFTNNNYIKNYSDMFETLLINVMIERFENPEILIDKFVGRTDLKMLQTKSVPIFANTSIREKMIPIPNIVEYPKFKSTMFSILEEAHNNVKLELANLRKDGKAPAKKISDTKPKEVLTFDSVMESDLLTALSKSKTDLDKHFSMIQLQNFYYKYRDIDKKYLDLCIDYCNRDIASLDDVQKSYYTTEVQKLKYLKEIYSSAEMNKEISKIGTFLGVIPAFSRLAIIYEKRKDYDIAIKICQQTISYYKKYGVSHDIEEFTNRLDKLLNKKANK